MSEERILIPISFNISDVNTTTRRVIKGNIDITPFIKAAIDHTMDTMLKVFINTQK